MGVRRGIALFFGLFSLLNGLSVFGGSPGQDIWWIDFGFLASWLEVTLSVGSAFLLLAYATVPRDTGVRFRLTVLIFALLAYAASANAIGVREAVDAGSVSMQAPFSFSAVLVVLFGTVAVSMLLDSRREMRGGRLGLFGAVLIATALCLVFPLVQISLFGTTDYRRPAQAAVVFGAKAWPDGRLSTSLEDRVRTACELHEAGLVDVLVMSGGTGVEGVDESRAMRDRAIALGVPASAIIVDPDGVDTEATVRNTAALFAERGLDRILVVSQFYHLPRIKMAYRDAGFEVFTVPATESWPIPGTARSVIREIPAFWFYWARCLW